MELALDGRYIGILGFDGDVSILVFVELALDVGMRSSRGFHIDLFQSLFSWNLLLMLFS